MTTATATPNLHTHVSTTGFFAQLETSKIVDTIHPQDIIDKLQLNSWVAVKHPNLNEDGESGQGSFYYLHSQRFYRAVPTHR